MGFLLKEVLKSLCGRNQWSYAVFWKIGCHNSNLLIWEECYYEPLPCPPQMFGMPDLPYQNGIQEDDRVSSLINKMIVNNSVSIAGEGIIGRAAFIGSHQWILLNSFTKDAYPPEVYAEVHHQFSDGIQTVAVIPVLPHGVVQFGSFLPIIENIGFVNDVKSLILQLGCVPGALLSGDYSAKLSNERLAEPAIPGVPVSVNPPLITSNCTPSVINGSNQQSNSSHTSRLSIQAPCSLKAELNTCPGSTLTPQTCKLNQITNSLCQPQVIPMNKPHFAGRRENRVVEAEVISSNLDSCLQQHSVAYNARSTFNNLTGSGSLGLSGPSDGNLTYMEQQIISAIRNQDNANHCLNASNTLHAPQQKIDGGHILGNNVSSGGISLLGGIPIYGGMSNLMRSNPITRSGSKFPQASTADLSGVKVGIGFQNCDSSNKAGGCSSTNLTSQSSTFPMHVEGSYQKILPVDLKCASTNQKIDNDLLQAPSFHAEEHVSISGESPSFSDNCLHKDGSSQSVMTMNPKHTLACANPPSGDDLFDVLGVDLKNKLLSGNWNQLFADELDGNAENMDKKVAPLNMQGTTASNIYSVKEAISDSGVFSAMGTDQLLDAVVSKAKSNVKQDSDDVSCRTTLTKNSTSSVPSHAGRPVTSGHFQGGLFDFPKNGGKTTAAETSFLRPGCNKDDAGNCSQTSSVYGSQLSSWVENSASVKRENSVSTGYSKRPDEACKPNRKRLKPGENPRPRPKDRQMIQDRVKELREIVPNSAKCSIDALLERTIKHMLFLQSVTKHADKLKQTGESKILNKDGGLLLKDNFEGGATWAYEVGSQSMVCPIVVEDLNPPRQMLVEMLCEERGFFLEIADLIRGLGLTILKGVMEARNDKIWACFAVEANRDVTRMEIFMSLVRLLEQTVKGNASSSNGIDNMMAYHSFPQATQIAATGRASSLQ